MQYGLKRTSADLCICYIGKKGIIVGVYVDDLIIRKLQPISHFKEDIKNVFVAKDLGPARHILFMKITQEEDGCISLDQTSYISEIQDAFKMTDENKQSVVYLHQNTTLISRNIFRKCIRLIFNFTFRK